MTTTRTKKYVNKANLCKGQGTLNVDPFVGIICVIGDGMPNNKENRTNNKITRKTFLVDNINF